jgi:hypothetical protein
MSEQEGVPRIECPLDGSATDAVAAVWAQVLGVDVVDPDVGFFDLGANSAMVVLAVRALRGRWPGLQVVDVFSCSTVERLAEYLGDE